MIDVNQIRKMEESIKESTVNANQIPKLLKLMSENQVQLLSSTLTSYFYNIYLLTAYLPYCHCQEESISLALLHALRRSFIHLIDAGKFISCGDSVTQATKKRKLTEKNNNNKREVSDTDDDTNSTLPPMEKYRLWLIQQYKSFTKKLVGFMLLICLLNIVLYYF